MSDPPEAHLINMNWISIPAWGHAALQ